MASPDASGSSARQPVTGFSPLPGCYIFIVLALFIVGVVTWAGWTFYRQSQQLARFTEPEAKPPMVRAVTAEETAAVAEKLKAFQEAATAEEDAEATLTLTADEFNIMLAGFESLSEVRPLVSCRDIKPENQVVAQVSFPLNSLPGQRVYLNGEIHFTVGLHHEGGPYLWVTAIEVPGKEVPPGFLDIYQRGVMPGKTFGFFDDMILRNFRVDPALAPAFQKIKSVTSQPGEITFSTRKPVEAASTSPQENTPAPQ